MENQQFDPSSVELTAADKGNLQRFNRGVAERGASSGVGQSGFYNRLQSQMGQEARSNLQMQRALPQFQAQQNALNQKLNFALMPFQQRQNFEMMDRAEAARKAAFEREAQFDLFRDKQAFDRAKPSTYEQIVGAVGTGVDIFKSIAGVAGGVG